MKFQYLTPILIASTLGAPIKVGSLLTGLLASSAAIGAVDSFVPVSPLKVCPTTMMAQCPLSKVKDSFTSVVKAATSTVESDKEKTKKVIGELKEINRGACPALNSFA